MEDLRKLLKGEEASIAPEALGYRLRGLNGVLLELLREGRPDDPVERMRYLERVESVAWSAEFLSCVLARWLGKHIDDCEVMQRD